MNEYARVHDDPEQLIARASVRGGIELARLGEHERRALWDWYRNQEREMTEDRRLELLEQFIGLGFADDARVRSVLETVSSEARAQFAEFLLNTTPGTAYARSFHECWNDLPKEQRDALLKRFTKDDPERVIFVAPFIHLSHAYEGENRDRRLVVYAHAGTFERLSDLLDAVLEYEVRHPYVPPLEDDFVTGKIRSHTDWVFLQHSPAELLVQSIGSLTDARAMLVLPHAEQIARHNWIPTERLVSLAVRDRNRYEELATTEEQARRVSFHAQYRLAHPDEEIPETLGHYFFGPEAYRRQMEQIELPAKRRAAELLTLGYQSLAMTEPLPEFLYRMVKNGIPWMEAAQRLRATGPDIERLFEVADANGDSPYPQHGGAFLELMRFARRAFPPAEAAGVDRAVFRHVQKGIKEHGIDANSTESFALLYDRLAAAAPELTRRTLELLVTRAPAAVLLNRSVLEAARALGIAPNVRAAIQASVNTDPDYFLSHFDVMWKTVRDTSDVTLDDVRAMTEAMVRRYPAVLFSKRYAGAMSALIPVERRGPLVADLMRARRTEGMFLLSVLEDDSLASLHASARAHLSDSDVFSSVISQSFLRDRLIAALEPERVFRLALACRDADVAEALVGFAKQQVDRNPSIVQPWIRHWERIGAVGALAALCESIQGREGIVERVRAALARTADAFPRQAFTETVLWALGDEARPFLERYGEMAIRANPSLATLGRRGNARHKNLIEHVLGEQKTRALFLQTRHAIAYEKYTAASFGGSDVSKLVRDSAPGLLVFRELPSDTWDAFYGALRQRLSDNPFYPLCEPELLQERDREKRQDDVASYYVPESVWESVMASVLLKDSVAAMEHRDVLLAMPEGDERSSLVDALAFLVRHGHGDDRFDLSTDIGRREVFARMLQVLSSNLGLELPSGIDRLPVRTIQAQMTYFSKSARRHPGMAAAFPVYLREVARETFEQWRNWGDADATEDGFVAALERMKGEDILPMGVTLAQYRAWIRTDRLDVQEQLSFSASDVASGARDILSQAVADGHLSSEHASLSAERIEDELEQITAPLRESMARIRELDSRFAKARVDRRAGRVVDEPLAQEEQEHAALKSQVQAYRSENDRRIRVLSGLRYLERMKHLTSDELQTRQLEIEKTRVPWAKVFREIAEGVALQEPAFATDVERLRRLLDDASKELFGGGRVSRQTLTLDDAVDPVALFHVGEYPVQSCQHWDGTPGLNVGLLSYQMDPNVRMVFMRDAQGTLVSRAALRLLEREDGSPALFLERVYSSNVHPKIKEMTVRLVMRKADAMGIPLFTSRAEQVVEDAGDDLPTAKLESRGSRAGFVYTDAGGGKAPGGVYTIDDAVEIYRPTPP